MLPPSGRTALVPLSLLVAALAGGAGGACGGGGGGGAVTPTQPPPPPPPRQATRLGEVLDSLRVALDLPALAGAIVTGEGVAAEAVGARRAGGPLDVTAADRFHLGSNTKAMTAALLGTVVDEGRLAWDTPLATAFPPLAGEMRPEYRAVTVRELLAHVGGLVPNVPAAVAGVGSAAEQRARVVAWALAQPPVAARGTFAYSNVGYIVAGALAERLLARDYETLLGERLLRPLGVTTLGFGAMGADGGAQPWQHVIGVDGRRTAVAPGPLADNPPPYSPAGRAHMTIADWGRWVQWVLAADAGRAQPLLRPATAAMLGAAVAPAGPGAQAALGWLVVERGWAGGRTLTHSGSNTLSYSVAWLAPGRGFAVLVATNQAGGDTDRRVDAVAGRLLRLHETGR